MKCNEHLNENEVFGDLKCRRLEYDCKQAMTNRIGAYPWVSSRTIDMDAVDVSFSGTPSKTTRRHRCCWTPWKGGQVSTSSQKEEWHTLVCRRTPCRQLPRRWTGSDTRFQHLPHQLQHMQGHQLPRSRDLRSGVKHLSHLFKNLAHTFVFFSFSHYWCHYRPAEGGRSDPSRTLRRCQQLPHWMFHLDKQTNAINHQHLNDNYFPIPTQKITSYYHPLNISLSLFKTKHQTAMLSATGQLIAGITQWLNGLLPRLSVPDKYTNSLIHSDP